MTDIHRPVIEKQQYIKQQLQALMEHLVSFGAQEETLDSISQQLQLLNQNLDTLKRPIAHFNNHLATSEANFALPYSPVCGPLNPAAPPLALSYRADEQCLYGRLNCPKIYEGPKGLMHGGIIAAIYDQILAMLTTCLDRPSFTAYLNVQYQKPTPIKRDLVFKAFVEKIEGRKAYIAGQCWLADELLTQASGLFIQAS